MNSIKNGWKYFQQKDEAIHVRKMERNFDLALAGAQEKIEQDRETAREIMHEKKMAEYYETNY